VSAIIACLVLLLDAHLDHSWELAVHRPKTIRSIA